MLTKNTSILYNLSSSNSSSSERQFSLRAVNRCGQQGYTANSTIIIEVAPTLTTNGNECTCVTSANHYNGVEKGIRTN